MRTPGKLTPSNFKPGERALACPAECYSRRLDYIIYLSILRRELYSDYDELVIVIRNRPRSNVSALREFLDNAIR